MSAYTVRFQIPVMPKDGGPHKTLSMDVEDMPVPRRDDYVGIWDGYGSHVLGVSYYPSWEPCVWVRCQSLFPETTAEAKEIIDKAVRDEGWKVVG